MTKAGFRVHRDLAIEMRMHGKDVPVPSEEFESEFTPEQLALADKVMNASFQRLKEKAGG